MRHVRHQFILGLHQLRSFACTRQHDRPRLVYQGRDACIVGLVVFVEIHDDLDHVDGFTFVVKQRVGFGQLVEVEFALCVHNGVDIDDGEVARVVPVAGAFANTHERGPDRLTRNVLVGGTHRHDLGVIKHRDRHGVLDIEDGDLARCGKLARVAFAIQQPGNAAPIVPRLETWWMAAISDTDDIEYKRTFGLFEDLGTYCGRCVGRRQDAKATYWSHELFGFFTSLYFWPFSFSNHFSRAKRKMTFVPFWILPLITPLLFVLNLVLCGVWMHTHKPLDHPTILSVYTPVYMALALLFLYGLQRLVGAKHDWVTLLKEMAKLHTALIGSTRFQRFLIDRLPKQNTDAVYWLTLGPSFFFVGILIYVLCGVLYKVVIARSV